MMQRWTAVVAGALMGGDGRWLMHKRPPGKHHAGLWEFPGGKVEPDEMPIESLIRELSEEIGIRCDPATCSPAGFAETSIAQSANAIVILLYTVGGWDGVPESLEGGEVGWFTPQQALALAKPPLDVMLAQQLFQNR
ncbi:MAG: DNA mismatch repair protein MutT [Alphaproteobacteria bacterium HGW-Alphaproteobacteria-7]|jgi:8-oxo-dGTP diphosphatase|nr:MAG: DNA mismatch repair protein MutT [Alphaproteobacteria bacterium HGW-Alphaproteobacteria-7]